MARFGDYPVATLPLAGDEVALLLQDGTTRGTPVSNLGGRDVTPASFGGTSGGTTDAKAAIQLALAAAAETGGWVDLGYATWGVTGSLTLGEGAKLRNGTLKQLSPGDTTKTIYATGRTNIRLENVSVDRNGTGAQGSTNTQGGIWLDTCTDPWLVDVEVYGDDKGNGIVFWGCVRPTGIRLNVHDLHYSTVETDDVIQGVWLVLCTDALLIGPDTRRMGSADQTTYLRDRYSRGIAGADNNGVRIVAPKGERLDQWMDFSGSGGNSGVVIEGGYARWILSNGAKFANTATGCLVSNTLIEQCGTGAFIVSGPDGVYANPIRDISFVGCTARNTGTPGNNTGGTRAGFYVLGGAAPLGGYPKNVRAIGCQAFSDTGSSAFTLTGDHTLTLATSLSLQTGVRCRLTTTGALPTGLATATDYWIIEVIDSMTIRLATSIINAQDGTYITGLSGGSGTHTITLQSDMSYGRYATGLTQDSTAPLESIGFRCSGAVVADSAGWPSPIADVYRSTTQSLVDNTESYLAPNAATYDPLSISGQGSTSAVFTAHKEGRWSLQADVSFAYNASGSRQLYVQANRSGGGYAAEGFVNLKNATDSVGTNALPMTVHWTGRIARGDTVRAAAVQNSGGALNITITRLVFTFLGD